MDQHQYRQAEAALAKVAAAVQRQEDLDLSEVTQLASSLVDSLHTSDQLVVEALSSPPGSPLVTNLINVGILATKVGIGLGYFGTELRRLALAGLLHDIGIFAVPQELLTKTGRLSAEERRVLDAPIHLLQAGRDVDDDEGKAKDGVPDDHAEMRPDDLEPREGRVHGNCRDDRGYDHRQEKQRHRRTRPRARQARNRQRRERADRR